MSSDFSHTLRRFLTSRVALVGSIVVCAMLFFQLIQVVTRSASTGKDIAALQTQVDSLQSEQKRLEQLRSFLQTDFFAEQEARTKFGLQKDGEHAVIISNKDDRSDSGSTAIGGNNRSGAGAETAESPVSQKSGAGTALKKNYHRWWQFFFSRD